MTRMFWRLVHHLPWSVTRLLCDMCRELGRDPKKIAAEMAEVHGPSDRRIAGWSCDHMTLTTYGGYVSSVSTWCGCRMEPVYDDIQTTNA